MVNKKTKIVVIIVAFAVICVLFVVNGTGKSTENTQNNTYNNSTNISCGSCDDFAGNSRNNTTEVVPSLENSTKLSSSSCCES
ncbi:MAG: hypothetical protein U1C19_07570 [Methanobacteriaceae archaeon]|jgi:flagellar basal body-associated protein FliL|nr:hypothetical protein [Methanobacteriaceae archaeon]